MKYRVIYADPPWETTAGRPLGGYKMVEGKQVWHSDSKKSRQLEYPTMNVTSIASMPIYALREEDAHLYMWVTNSHLPFAFDIIKAWGFNYSTTLVWAKNPMGSGLGGAFRINTEFLLFARRGNLKTTYTTIGTWFNVKRQYENGYPKHSKKPDFFRQLIEKTSPGPYLELFARSNYPGWDAFGNECVSIDLAIDSSTITENKQ